MTEELSTVRSEGDSDVDAQKPVACIRWIFPVAQRPSVTPLIGEVVIGRDGACDVALPGRRVSRRHARVSLIGPLRVLRDLGSTNGVFVNGERVREAVLSPGDLVRVGDTLGLACLAAPGELASSYQRFAPDLLGGPALAAIVARAREAARDALPVVLEGETGTGKERLARAIHTWSGRRGPFLAVNCAGLPRELAAAELFGARRGAFTGADGTNAGYFLNADGGTLLLDEITDLPFEVQGMLLRAIQEREVASLGTTRAMPVDIKLLATTQVPLGQAVARGWFRADLRARLETWRLRLPPLRDRREDVPFVMVAKLADTSGNAAPELAVTLMERLCLHDWPLNLRELHNVAQRMAPRLSDARMLAVRDLPETFGSVAGCDAARAPQPPRAAAPAAVASRLRPSRGDRAYRPDDIQALLTTLRAVDGNVADAAERLGISRARAYRLLRAAERARSTSGEAPVL